MRILRENNSIQTLRLIVKINMADLLQEKHQDGDEGGSLLFQSEESSRCSDKQLGVSVRHVVLETVLSDDGLHSLSV